MSAADPILLLQIIFLSSASVVAMKGKYKERVLRNLTKRAKELGFELTLFNGRGSVS
jgi:hypothetical protein